MPRDRAIESAIDADMQRFSSEFLRARAIVIDALTNYYLDPKPTIAETDLVYNPSLKTNFQVDPASYVIDRIGVHVRFEHDKKTLTVNDLIFFLANHFLKKDEIDI